jgi:hypothetical protein
MSMSEETRNCLKSQLQEAKEPCAKCSSNLDFSLCKYCSVHGLIMDVMKQLYEFSCPDYYSD